MKAENCIPVRVKLDRKLDSFSSSIQFYKGYNSAGSWTSSLDSSFFDLWVEKINSLLHKQHILYLDLFIYVLESSILFWRTEKNMISFDKDQFNKTINFIMGDQLRAPLKSLITTVLWCLRGFRGALNRATMMLRDVNTPDNWAF